MTQPTTYQYPPGYPPPPMPGAYPAPTQSYPTQTQNVGHVQHAAPGTMPGGDQFTSPTRVVNVVRPRIMDIGPGRLLLLKPTKIERGVKNDLSPDPNATQDRLTADVVVLDGPPFPYGGKPEKGIPHTHTSNPPEEWPGLWLTQDLIVRQCEKSIGGMVLGRLVRGQASDPKRNAPWRLDEPTEDDKVIARQYLAGAAVAAAASPAPVMPQPPAVNAPPSAPAQALGYPVGAQQSAPPAYAPGPPPPPVWNPATNSWDFPTAPDPAVAAAAQGYMTGPPGAQYAPPVNAPQYGAQPAAYPPPAAAPALDIDTPPPGMDPAMWASMPAEHRAAIAASVAARPPWQ